MIEINGLNIVGVASLAIMLAGWYSPIQKTKDRFVNLFSRVPFIHTNLNTALNCSKCTGLILGIIFFRSIVIGVVVSLIAYFLNHFIDKTESWYE